MTFPLLQATVNSLIAQGQSYVPAAQVGWAAFVAFLQAQPLPIMLVVIGFLFVLLSKFAKVAALIGVVFIIVAILLYTGVIL